MADRARRQIIPGAVFRAVRYGRVSEVKGFLANGGDPNDERELPGEFEYGYERRSLLLHEAVDSGHEETATMVRMLLDHGARVDAIDWRWTGETALWSAIDTDEAPLDVIGMLIDEGADVNCGSSRNPGLLRRAVEQGNAKKFYLLLRAGADSQGVWGWCNRDHLLRVPQHSMSFEEALEHFPRPTFGDDGPDLRPTYEYMRKLVAGVRAAGSYKRLVRQPHMCMLVLRALCRRARAMLVGESWLLGRPRTSDETLAHLFGASWRPTFDDYTFVHIVDFWLGPESEALYSPGPGLYSTGRCFRDKSYDSDGVHHGDLDSD